MGMVASLSRHRSLKGTVKEAYVRVRDRGTQHPSCFNRIKPSSVARSLTVSSAIGEGGGRNMRIYGSQKVTYEVAYLVRNVHSDMSVTTHRGDCKAGSNQRGNICRTNEGFFVSLRIKAAASN